MKLNKKITQNVKVDLKDATLDGFLSMPKDAKIVVIFVHGSGSSRHSDRNQFVAGILNEAQIATLLIDLLTAEEEIIDKVSMHLRFDIDLLTKRVLGATKWLEQHLAKEEMAISYFGASTGAAAALKAAAIRGAAIKSVVSRGGRPDLAKDSLPQVQSPTLLIVGERDYDVIKMNQEALDLINAKKELTIVPKATHLFEEEGTLLQVANLACAWFKRYG